MITIAGLFLIGSGTHGTVRLVIGIVMVLIGIISCASDNR